MNPFVEYVEDYLIRYVAETTKPRIPISRYLDGQTTREWSGSDAMDAWWNYRGETADE
jgi:hypothetical protein